MSKPLIAIVGRPNVGKSALFNRLCQKRISVVEDTPGVTRDRVYADMDVYSRTCTLIDTGGLDPSERAELTRQVAEQAKLALTEADLIVFVVDYKDGPTSTDYEIADLLRQVPVPMIFIANKCDNMDAIEAEFYGLRFGEPIYISALHGLNIDSLIDRIAELLPPEEEAEAEPETSGIRVAIVGRPNVGKSSLLNRILGEERAIVSEIPGTTRDAIDTRFVYGDTDLTLIDTSGMRRKGQVKESLEYYCVLRALRAVERADVVVLVIDGKEGVTIQDSKIGGYAHEAGKAIVIAVNKWDVKRDLVVSPEEVEDGIQVGDRERARRERLIRKDVEGSVRRSLIFLAYAPIVFTSATRGFGVKDLLDQVIAVYQGATLRVATGPLNSVIAGALMEHQPPVRKGRRLKVYYGTQPKVSPPTIVLFVNDPELVHFSYLRYLENKLREKFGFMGTPLRISVRRSKSKEHDPSLN